MADDKIHTISVEYEFTEDELKAFADEMSEIEDLKLPEAEEAVSAAKTQQKFLEARMKRLASLYRARRETRRVDCRAEWHSPKPGVVRLIGLTDGRTWEEREMTNKEMEDHAQMPMC